VSFTSARGNHAQSSQLTAANAVQEPYGQTNGKRNGAQSSVSKSLPIPQIRRLKANRDGQNN
jgi:hypothetical protein